MSERISIRDLELLQDLQARFAQFDRDAQQILARVERTLNQAQIFLDERMHHWQSELRRREAALAECLAAGSPLAAREADAVREAQQAIETLRKLLLRLERITGEYKTVASALRNQVERKLPQSKSRLEEILQRYNDYLHTLPNI